MLDSAIQEDLQNVRSQLGGLEKGCEGKIFLVTGGAGFLGSWVTDVLAAFKAKIITVDNFASGQRENIAHLEPLANVVLVNADVCSFYTQEHVDYIVHMASIASPRLYQEHPVESLDANVIGIKRMLEIARRSHVKGFLYTSSSEVYGNPPDSMIPTPEDYCGCLNPCGPRSMYDEGKRCGEAYCYSYWKQFGVPIRIARIFNTYGPRLDPQSTNQYGRVVARFISQALDKNPISIYGDGEQTRSFCYVTDQITGLLKLLLAPRLDGEAINIGNDQETTIRELAQKISKAASSKSLITYDAPSNYDLRDDPRRRCPNINKARSLLGYQPAVNLELGLGKTVNWFKTQRL